MDCVLLHTSSKYERFHLEKKSDGKIIKVPWEPGQPSKDENSIKYVRILRKPQEQIHGSLKQRFKFLDMRHLPNTILQPLTENELKKYGMTSEYKDTPKLHYQVIVCCSLINSQHPGYYPLSMDSAGEYRTAKIILHRLFQENPLLHSEKWPYDFTNIKPGQTWTTTTFKELKETDVLQFPRINRDQINPTAVELSGSVHALQKADGT